MEKFNVIQLLNTNDFLAEKGILKGNYGLLIDYLLNTKEWVVMFYSPMNLGDYAIANVSEDDIEFKGALDEKTVDGYKKMTMRPDFYSHTAFTPLKFKEYDRVALAVDRPCYLKEGVKKGMIGCVMDDTAITGRRQVIFSEDDTGEDIADILIAESDLVLVGKDNKDIQ